MQQTATAASSGNPLSEKSRNVQAGVAQPSRASSTKRKRRASGQADGSDEKAERIEDKDAISIERPTTGKENVEGGYRRKESIDEITALPVKWKLEHSPHLRPADSERPAIPYNFLNSPPSQTSLPRTADGAGSKSLRSKRSTIDGPPSRRKSSKKRPNEKVREEEIRAMSAAMPELKRNADGSSKRESWKRRTFDSKNEASILTSPTDATTAPNAAEKHTWDIEHFWINPRPAVRLSTIPAYTLQDIPDVALPISLAASEKIKGKAPAREPSRKHTTIGEEAEILDSGDIRTVLERDAKRREKKDRERQERLDRKLRAVEKSGPSGGKDGERSGRSKGKHRQDVGMDKAVEAGLSLVALQRPELDRAPSSVHPALRDEPMFSADESIGLGIERPQENPFADPVAGSTAQEGSTEVTTGAATPLASPFEDPVIETAREVRMATAITPPLSPVEGRRRSSLMALNTLPPRSTPVTSPTSPTTRRTGSESKDRRAGAWASFFKRGGTQREGQPPTSFSNTSRESMSSQPVPLHLVTSRETMPSTGLTRTRSKFREDLPDAPLSPPDSRVQSPELPTNAAAIAAAAAASYKVAADESADTQAGATEPTSARSDTPVSPIRGHSVLTTASLASVDSEGSWLASGGSMKRASAQSGLSRSYGSLTRRNPDFNASFEDLGETGDKDAEYIRSGADAQRAAKVQSALLEEDDDAQSGAQDDDAMTVHETVQRVPTLVRRDPAVRSREGLLSEFSAEDRPATDTAVKDGSSEDDEDGTGELENARSIDYTSRHARQVSAGSVQLLDVIPRRMSTTQASPSSPVITTTTNKTMTPLQAPKTSEEDTTATESIKHI